MEKFTVIILLSIILLSCKGKADEKIMEEIKMEKDIALDSIVLGGGCFWCVEAVFQRLNGVISVESGYTGGKTLNPTYEDICSGSTGHAEVVKVTYNSNEIKLEELLEVFFATHDPTTLNRQGADVGTQYRSVIYYNNPDAESIIRDYINFLVENKAFDNPIVTEVSPATTFYKAENYHQNYYNNHTNQPYCRMVINPKINKLNSKFYNKLKK